MRAAVAVERFATHEAIQVRSQDLGFAISGEAILIVPFSLDSGQTDISEPESQFFFGVECCAPRRVRQTKIQLCISPPEAPCQ